MGGIKGDSSSLDYGSCKISRRRIWRMKWRLGLHGGVYGFGFPKMRTHSSKPLTLNPYTLNPEQ